MFFFGDCNDVVQHPERVAVDSGKLSAVLHTLFILVPDKRSRIHEVVVVERY